MSANLAVGRLSEFNPAEEDIKAYLLRLKHFFKANNVEAENEVSVLITVIGPRNLAILSDLVAPSEVDSKTYAELTAVLESHFSPKKLIVAERFMFYSRTQKPGETISEFVVSIKHLATTCKFGSFLNDALRDKLVAGISNENIRQKLLSEEKGFKETLELAIRLEQAEKQSNMFGSSHVSVAKFSVQRGKMGSLNNNNKSQSGASKFPNKSGSSPTVKCYRCGSNEHVATSCPYSNYKCKHCNKVGHLFKMCNSRKNKHQVKPKRKYSVHQIEQEAEFDENVVRPMEELSLFNIGLGNFNPDGGYKVCITINDVPISMEVDTGSAISICPEEIFNEKFSNVQIQPSNIKLKTYAGNEVPVLGQATVDVQYGNQCVELPLVIVKLDGKNQPMLLGRNWLEKVRLDWHSIIDSKARTSNKATISYHENSKVNKPSLVDKSAIDILKQRYNSVFQPGTGEIKGVKANIVLKEGTVPKFCKFRPVPYALREDVSKELDRMIQDGVAYKVTNSEWATPLVVVPKPKGVRLCADFKVTLNQFIETEHYPLPQAQDIFASLAGYSVFSCLDLSNAYQQLSVAEESQHLLTLSTHKGLIRLRRLPFGLSSAPAIFQAAIDQILAGLPGAIAYLDDVIIAARSPEEALQRLEKVLQRFEEFGVKVNQDKCKFLQSSVDYLGHVISAEGLRPLESNLTALKDAPEPTSKEELRAYVGLINYYHSFIPNLSAKLSCFYDLLHKDAQWNWTKECSDTFRRSKSWVLNSSLLVHYDVTKPLVLTCDASPRGVGAVLSHLINGVERPIAFASKTLSRSEQNYSQLHREALALIFGVKKFHKYIYGRKCVLQTDHQPLAAIFGSKRGIPSMAAARLQRWSLILSAYDLEVKYRKGPEVPHADALSRLPLPNDESIELESNYVSHVQSCVEVMNHYCSVSDLPDINALDVARLTDRDPVLAKVKDFVMHGWKEVKDTDIAIFWRRKDELSVDQGCLVWGSRVVIPSKLRPAVLRMLHDQHPGITRMKLLARSYVWWPGLEKDIEEQVTTCIICQSTRNAAPNVPLQQWPMSTRRWQRIHIDYAQDPESRNQLLIVVDTFSKWLEVFIMKSTTSTKTIECLRTLFSSYGLPEELVSDNATCFSSYEFKEFLQKNGVRFKLIPPYHPQSNGAAERSVQEVKKSLLRQVLEDHQNSHATTLQHKLDNFLFAYRNTPSSVTGHTPAELFLQWKPRTKLSMLKPNLLTSLQQGMNRRKQSEDKRRGLFREFVEGQNVYVRTVRLEKVTWVPGKILVKRSPVTYLVSVLGKTRYCHADHLRAAEGLQEEETLVPVPQSQSQLTSPLPQLPLEESKTPESRPAKRPDPGNQLASPAKDGSSSCTSSTNTSSTQEGMAQCSAAPLLRRSARNVKKPQRLDL
jgi:hypothetical protein